MTRYAYVRVSSTDQNVSRQLDWLEEVAPDIPRENIFIDKISSRYISRPAYDELKEVVTKGDEVYVKELDRLGRLKRETKDELEWFRDRGVTLRIGNIPTTLVDTGDAEWISDLINEILIAVLTTFGQQELELRAQRQAEGIAAAKARGEHLGRPRETDRDEFIEQYELVQSGEITIKEAQENLDISRSTWYRLVKELSYQGATPACA